MEEEIMNYLVSLIPAITAILTVVSSIFVCIKKVKDVVKSNDSANAASQKELTEMRAQITNVLAENAELKKELKKTLYTLNNVEVPKDEQQGQ